MIQRNVSQPVLVHNTMLQNLNFSVRGIEHYEYSIVTLTVAQMHLETLINIIQHP